MNTKNISASQISQAAMCGIDGGKSSVGGVAVPILMNNP